MSDRRHWKAIKSSVVEGDAISGCRDNESRTYRLFVNKGVREVKVAGGHVGWHIDSCQCCDLSINDIRELNTELYRVIAEHEPWPEDEEI